MAGKKVLLTAMAALFVVSQAQAAQITGVGVSEVVYPGASRTSEANLANLLSDDLTAFFRTGLTPWPHERPDSIAGFYTFIFTFDQAYLLDTINIWNFWNPDTGRTYDGVRNIEMYISPTDDPADFGAPLAFELSRTANGNWIAGLTPEQAYANSGFNVLDMEGVEAMMVKLVILDCWTPHTYIRDEQEYYHPFSIDRGTGLNGIAFFAVPEPATMSLLALGGLALLRRR